ncbi:MAG TPA: hypothetical protein ENN43_07855 [bacterium]|nr:hypothetical protein [bacterium]
MKTIIHLPNNKKKLRSYINGLKKRGMTIEFGKYIFDAEALFYFRYECDPVHCLRELKGRHFGSCCTDYTVDLACGEAAGIYRALEKGARLCAEKFPWVLKEKILIKNRNGTFYIRHRKNNTCALSFVKDNRIFCVIDAIAEEYGLSRKKYKPSVCYSWPIECVEYNGKTFVTVINKKNGRYLSQITGNLKCVSGKVGGAAAFSLKSHFIDYLGERVYNALIGRYNKEKKKNQKPMPVPQYKT